MEHDFLAEHDGPPVMIRAMFPHASAATPVRRDLMEVALACHRAADDFGQALVPLAVERMRQVAHGEPDEMNLAQTCRVTAQLRLDLMKARLVFGWLAVNPDVAALIPDEILAGEEVAGEKMAGDA